MNRKTNFLLLAVLFVSCNPTLTEFSFIYNNEGPNQEIARRMEKLLEDISYEADKKSGEKVSISKDYVEQHLGRLV